MTCPFCDRMEASATGITGRTMRKPRGQRVPFCLSCLSQASRYRTVDGVKWFGEPRALDLTPRDGPRRGTRAPARTYHDSMDS